jgi:hypothetical protein
LAFGGASHLAEKQSSNIHIMKTLIAPLALLVALAVAAEASPLPAVDWNGSQTVFFSDNDGPFTLGFHLEYAESLPATVWNTVTNVPTVIGDNFVVPLPNTGVQRYFRLGSP